MNTHEWARMAGLVMVSAAGVALASQGMPWESPLQTVAQSISGPAGGAVCTAGIAWSGFNCYRGTEHGKEALVSAGFATGIVMGAPRIVAIFGGGASGASLDVTPLLPVTTFLSDLVGELLGHGVYAAWLFGALLLPLAWRRHA